MNDEDLRDLFAGFAMVGLMKLHINEEALAAAFCYRMADAMIEAKYAEKEPEMGITAAKPKRKRSANVSAATD
jgi:hypothetical protein